MEKEYLKLPNDVFFSWPKLCAVPNYYKENKDKKTGNFNNQKIGYLFGALKRIRRVHGLSHVPILRVPNALSYIQRIISPNDFFCRFFSKIFRFRELQHFILAWRESSRRLHFHSPLWSF